MTITREILLAFAILAIAIGVIAADTTADPAQASHLAQLILQ